MGTEKKAGDLEEIRVLEGISESEEIDRRVEELMAPEEEGNGKKKKKKQKQKTGHRSSEGGFHPVRRFKGFSRKRKIITVLVLAAVVLFGFSRMSGGKKDLGIPVAVMPLAKQDVQEKLTVSGPVSGTDSVDVVSNIHAEITAMNVKEGDTVTKGQVLAVVDSTDLEREVQIAQNAYDLAVANKQEKDKEAALGYEKAVQDFQKASLDHSRNSQLFATGDISQMELEASANALNDARRQMEGYTVENGRGVADSSYGIQIQNAAFDLEKKKEELDNTQIKSTIDGTVVRVNSKVGQFADLRNEDVFGFILSVLEHRSVLDIFFSHRISRIHKNRFPKRNQIQNKNIEYHSTQNNEYITAPTHQRYEHILAVPVYLPVLRRNIRT